MNKAYCLLFQFIGIILFIAYSLCEQRIIILETEEESYEMGIAAMVGVILFIVGLISISPSIYNSKYTGKRKVYINKK